MHTHSQAPSRRALTLVFGLLAFGCGGEDDTGSRPDLPSFSGPVQRIGAFLCLTGNAAARTPELDRAAILAEEFINGSNRVFSEQEREIACRINDNCGVWAGRDEFGFDIRGPLEVVVADSAGDPNIAVQSATRLRDEFDSIALVGGCNSSVVESVFRDVTRTETLLVTPVVTSGAITALPDRTPQEATTNGPGWVYRTVSPDRVLAGMLRVVGQNTAVSRPLVRFEDQSDVVCRLDSECESLGEDYRCRASTRSETPDREFVTVSDVPCANEPPGFCDIFGLNYVCEDVDETTEPVCAQFRATRFCTREVEPKSAMVLYEESDFGRSLRDELRTAWTSSPGTAVLAEASFDPDRPDSFGNRVTTLFQLGNAELQRRRGLGQLEGTTFGDTVVFLLADAVDGSLLLQEWSAQLSSFAIEGAGRVFWLSTDRLRSQILTNQLSQNTIRNLHLVSSATEDQNNGPLFDEIYRNRWGTIPPDYAAQVFDAILLVALANERGAAETVAAQPGMALQGVPAAALKDAYPAVAGGCHVPTADDSCSDILGEVPITIRLPRFANAMAAARARRNFAFIGASGNLAMGPEGDRISDVALFKVEPAAGDKGRFFEVDRFDPEFFGISLR